MNLKKLVFVIMFIGNSFIVTCKSMDVLKSMPTALSQATIPEFVKIAAVPATAIFIAITLRAFLYTKIIRPKAKNIDQAIKPSITEIIMPKKHKAISYNLTKNIWKPALFSGLTGLSIAAASRLGSWPTVTAKDLALQTTIMLGTATIAVVLVGINSYMQPFDEKKFKSSMNIKFNLNHLTEKKKLLLLSILECLSSISMNFIPAGCLALSFYSLAQRYSMSNGL